ncbi:MAG TPA: trypsin-like serine protease, partial [Polyangiaceae bacterium]
MVSVSLLALLATACAIESEPDSESVAGAQQAIENGTVVVDDTIGNLRVFASFEDGVGLACSGTIVTQDWVLTARHCVDRRPTALTSSIVDWKGETRTVIDVVNNDQLDVSLLHLDSPYAIGTPGTFVNPPWTGTTAALVGQNVDCYGYGPNEIGGPIGTLRTATLEVLTAAPNGTYYNTEQTHRRLPGDSGSACFLTSGGVRYQVGVHSQGWVNDVSAEAYRDWLRWNVLPSCTDGHQSIFEDGIDCGGMCPACPPAAVITYPSNWGTGYCANIAVTNRQERNLRWTVEYDVHESAVYTQWGAVFSNTGSAYTAQGEPWNQWLGPLQTANFAFCANKTGSNWTPTITNVTFGE